jgi:hippurate hydrolase
MRRPASAIALTALGLCAATSALAKEASELAGPIEAIYPAVDALYRDLHQHPELSEEEVETAAKLADRLRRLGYQVTTGVGRNGLVALLRNGAGPTVALRTELDGIAVEEKTALPFASKVVVTRGETRVPVMHACGHDIHMASLVGAATLLAQRKEEWRGTLVLIGQPAEETLTGAKAMLADGLFRRFPKPDFMVAIHDTPVLPAGKVGITPGPAQASVDYVDLTLYGKGGHGGHPHRAIDPIVLAARTVLALQTIVSRENDPFDPAVLTIGAIHGGVTANVIPDEVKLSLTVRAFSPEVRERMLSAIERIAKGETSAAGAPRAPTVTIRASTPVAVNDVELSGRLNAVLTRAFGAANVAPHPPIMPGEDFALYAREHVATVMIRVGAVEPQRFEAARLAKITLPANHSPLWAPDRERTLRAGVLALAASALDLLGHR